METTNLPAGSSGYVLTMKNGIPTWTIPEVNYAPTSEELEKYPTLKSTWEQYLITRKLLGI